LRSEERRVITELTSVYECVNVRPFCADIGIEELKAVPLAVLEHLKPVPSSYLKQISRDVDLFRQLPVEVQRQCWVGLSQVESSLPSSTLHLGSPVRP
jgi:hypothetical protein